tara:strand:+ start:676 stop:837 length:162 start_codon:yes stop_codon:yes gene_type:complete
MKDVIEYHDSGDENDNVRIAESSEMISKETIEAINERNKLRAEIEEEDDENDE